MTEDEVIGWHHRLDGHEFEQAPRDGDRQGSLAYPSGPAVKTMLLAAGGPGLIPA